MIGKLFGIMSRPNKTWQDIAEMSEGKFRLYLVYPAILALIPAFAWYYGTTQVGWSLGDRESIKMSVDSAKHIAPFFYLAHLVAIAISRIGEDLPHSPDRGIKFECWHEPVGIKKVILITVISHIEYLYMGCSTITCKFI